MPKLLNGYFNLVRKFIPSKSDESSIGLDVGAGECKIIEMRRCDGNSFELLNWAIEPISDGDVKSTIKKVIDRLENPVKNLYTSVFGKGTLLRYIDLPRMSLSDLKNSFSIEADKYFPFTKDQIYIDCFILDPESKGKQMAVLAAAAKRELVDERIRLLSGLELPSDFIGINSVALSNVINVAGVEETEEKDAAVALLDLGESISNLTIFKNKIPLFTRDIFQGGRDLTKRISNALGISFEEAEKIKRDPGERREEVVSICESAIMNIAHELKLSFEYFTTEKSSEVKAMLLTGGASMLEGVADSLEKNLELSVSRWNPLATLKLADSISKEEIETKSLRLGVALGLALYHYD